MNICIVALEYLESYYAQTEACLQAISDKYPIVRTSRSGFGSFSRAMNVGFAAIPPETELVWFVSDILFTTDVPGRLADSLLDKGWGAIQPSYASDHFMLRPDGSGVAKETIYIEWTAPMVRADLFRQLGGLDERCEYFYQDLLFSKALREAGQKMGVHHGIEVSHIYHRADAVKEHITEKRYARRVRRESVEHADLANRFGPRWRDVLWCR